MTKRILVMGCGSIGRRHIQNLRDLGTGDILAFDIEEGRAKKAAEEFGVKFQDRLEFAWKAQPDIAFVTASTREHVPLALEAARHGCHLFIEKPLSDRRDQVDQLLKEVRKRNLVTLVGCNMRFHPDLLKVKALLNESAIGRVVAARAEVGQYLPDWHPQEDYRKGYSARQDLGGGIILDGIHEIDYLRWMLGEVKSVACFMGQLSHLEIDTEDTAAILLRFADQAIGEIHLDYVQRTYSRSCHWVGDEGTIRWNFVEGGVHWYSAKSAKWSTFHSSKDWVPNRMYVDELKHFLRCVAGEESSALDVFEGARVLDIALAAKTSAQNGEVVPLEA